MQLFYAHFTDEETEAQRGYDLPKRVYGGVVMQIWNLTPEPVS